MENLDWMKNLIFKGTKLKIVKEKNKGCKGVFLSDNPYEAILQNNLIICDKYPEKETDLKEIDDFISKKNSKMPTHNMILKCEGGAVVISGNIISVENIVDNLYNVETDSISYLIEVIK